MRRALLIAAVLLAGCGDDGKPAYEREVRAAVGAARETGGKAPALHAAAARLRRLDPPEEVAGPHRDLVAAFDAIADAQERGGEPPDAVIDRLLAARRAFGARGYDIGVYGSP